MGNNEPAVDQSDFRIRGSYGLIINKLYSAISHSSAIVKSIFLCSSSLIYRFFGHNYNIYV